MALQLNGNGSFTGSDISLNGITFGQTGILATPAMPHWAGSVGSSSGPTSSGVANQAIARLSRGGLTFSNERWTVPLTGVYFITFQTICSNTSGRKDTWLNVNGATFNSCLSEDNGTGFHQRTHAASLYLNANDYIQVSSASWYNVVSPGEVWQTVTITYLG